MRPHQRTALRSIRLQRELQPSELKCLRSFHESASLRSGHSRWSKIKHDKGKADALKNRQRSVFAKELTTTSKLFGGDPNSNPKLADLIVKAKREGFAKASIEAAIARGQGRSLSGASLEQVSVEAMLPQNVACIIDCETDNKLRTLADVRTILKDNGGMATPTNYLFTRKGQIVFEAKEGTGVDEVFEQAIEVGALDVLEGDEGRIIVFTEPNEVKSAGETISTSLGLDIVSSEIIWDPNEETQVPLEHEETANDICRFIDELQQHEASVQGIYMNATQGSVSEGAWAELLDRLDT